MPKRVRKKKGQQGNAAASGSFKDQGGAAFAAGNFKEAIALFTAGIEEDGTVAALFSNRSACYAALKRFEEALADGEKAVELQADWPKGHYRKAVALENLLRYPEAFQAYKAGLELDPEDVLLKPGAESMMGLMQELGMKEANDSKNASPDDDVFDKMCQWMKTGGSEFPELYLRFYSEDYRGCHALTKIPAKKTILFVPHDHVMTTEVAKESEIGRAIIASNVSLRSKHSYLASFLLQEKHKGDKSFWAPFINVLPQHYANMPIFFDEEVLASLKGSFSLEKIASRIDSLRREFDRIYNEVPEFRNFTHEEFVWARLAVITRIFGMVINDVKTDGLVPYADMLNHKVPKETTWTFDQERNGFIITSLTAINRGEQVFDSYGRKCNSRFFVNYGFALDENEDNECIVRVELPRDDPHYQMKVQHMGGEEEGTREYQIPGHTYHVKKTKSLFSFLRFVHGKDKELMQIVSSPTLEEVDPVSIRNESLVLKTLRKACQDSMALYPDSLEHDETLLESGELPEYSNVRNCVLQRVGEKRALTWFIQLADRSIPMLQEPWKDLKKLANKVSRGKPVNFDVYLHSVILPLVKKGAN